MNIEPDGYLGAVMAVQGIPDATVVLHGQRGCRRGPLACHAVSPRTADDAAILDSPHYDGIYSVPYSGMTAGDYTGGSYSKLQSALGAISEQGYALSVLMSTPGVSILGDDCRAVADSCKTAPWTIVCDPCDFPRECPDGFDYMIRRIAEELGPAGNCKVTDGVAVLGLSLMQRDPGTFRHETSHLLMKGGLRMIGSPGVGTMVSETSSCSRASYGLCVCPEYCRLTSRLYSELGMEIICTGDAPVGFDAVEGMYREVVKATGRRMDHAFEMLNKFRRRAYDCIVASGADISGRTYRVDAVESVSRSLGDWLESSFGMIRSDDRPDFLFASGDNGINEETNGRCGRAVDIGFPSSGGVCFMKSPLFGLEGCMYVMDALFNPRRRTHLHETSSRGCDPGGCSCQ